MPINTKKLVYGYRTILRGFGRYKRRIILLIVLGILAGLFEGVGIGAVIPLFSIIMNETGVEELNFITRSVDKAFSMFKIPLTPLFLILLIITLFILKAILQFTARYINEKTIAEFEERTRKKMFKRSMDSSWPHLLNQKGGHLETLLIYDTERAATIFNLLGNFILLFTGFAMYTVVAFGISANFTLLTIGLGIAFFTIIRPVFYRLRKLAEKVSIFQKSVSHYVGELILGAKVIKTTAMESIIFQKTNKYFENLKKAKVKSSLYRQSSNALVEPGVLIIITLLFAFSYRSPEFNIVSFAVIIYLIRRMFSYVESMQTYIQAISENTPYLQNILIYNKEAAKNKEVDTGTEKFSFDQYLEFKNVSFSYDPRKKILQNISFKIKKGEVVGIVGPSGSGKTTIVDLILRLFNPQKGEILADNKNTSNIKLTQWRKNISYVPQDTFLIHDTIENNIKFYGDISMDDIIKVSKMANIYDTVQELPDKFNTVAGERGIKLSGGQRQRIALARALARNPKILILDEATSAIDAESEKLIQQSIKELKGKITIIIIAHRPSTIMNCDRLIVLEKGKIMEKEVSEKFIQNQESYFHKMN